jgi:hypothetical protein
VASPKFIEMEAEQQVEEKRQSLASPESKGNSGDDGEADKLSEKVADDNGSDPGSPGGGDKAKVEKVFQNFLERCDKDIKDRRGKRIELLGEYKQKVMSECTFQPKITNRGESAPVTQQIGHSLYYRGLLQSKARLERQKNRLEEVVQKEREACPFKPNSLQEVASKYVEFVRTPRMTTPQPTPRKEPLRLDLSEELNQNARDARDLYRQDPRHQKSKAGYLEASKDRFSALSKHLEEAIESNAPGEGAELEQGAFSSPLGAISGTDDSGKSPEKRLSFSENEEKRGSVKRGSILKNSSSNEADDT